MKNRTRSRKEVMDEIKTKAMQKSASRSAFERKEEIRLQYSYLRNYINGHYMAARANMLAKAISVAEQAKADVISETTEGVNKTIEFAFWERNKIKFAAIDYLRNAFFEREELKNKYGYDEEKLTALFERHMNKPLFDKTWDEEDKELALARHQAQFM